MYKIHKTSSVKKHDLFYVKVVYSRAHSAQQQIMSPIGYGTKEEADNNSDAFANDVMNNGRDKQGVVLHTEVRGLFVSQI